MGGQYLMTFALCMTLVAMTTSAPAGSDSKEKAMFPMENYEHFMPKQQQEFAEMALKNAGMSPMMGPMGSMGSMIGPMGSMGSSSEDKDSSGSKSVGGYKRFMPALEQKWFDKFNGGGVLAKSG